MSNEETNNLYGYAMFLNAKLQPKIFGEISKHKGDEKMSNEEINVLINLHIDELEGKREAVKGEASRRRLIKALKQATEIISKK